MAVWIAAIPAAVALVPAISERTFSTIVSPTVVNASWMWCTPVPASSGPARHRQRGNTEDGIIAEDNLLRRV
jgi:hypothetical protein